MEMLNVSWWTSSVIDNKENDNSVIFMIKAIEARGVNVIETQKKIVELNRYRDKLR